MDAFAQQAEALTLSGVDYLGLETFTDLTEARVALAAARTASDLEISVSLVPARSVNGYCLAGGESLAAGLKVLADAGATALGVNCMTGEDCLDALSEYLASTSLPLVMRPNAGLPRAEQGQLVYPQVPEDFARQIVQAVRLGAAAVGGCCGTHAGFTAALRTALG